MCLSFYVSASLFTIYNLCILFCAQLQKFLCVVYTMLEVHPASHPSIHLSSQPTIQPDIIANEIDINLWSLNSQKIYIIRERCYFYIVWLHPNSSKAFLQLLLTFFRFENFFQIEKNLSTAKHFFFDFYLFVVTELFFFFLGKITILKISDFCIVFYWPHPSLNLFDFFFFNY